MVRQLIRSIIIKPWARVGVAVALIIAGLAPIGVPILSDNSWRPAHAAADGQAAVARPFTYRTSAGSDDTTRVERSDDGGQTWHEMAEIPQREVSQIEAVRGNEQVVFARSQTNVWVSQDGGSTWTQTARLPSRPLSMAIAHETPGLLLVGTESMGLVRSNDSGASWQTVDSPVMAGGGAAPLGVTALAVNPEDEQIIYAASGAWLGTSQVRFNPLGVYVSVDGGRQWFEMARAPLGATPVQKLEPIPGQPMAVSATVGTSPRQLEQTATTYALALTPDLLSALDDSNASVRAAAARAMGLIGDQTALPTLLQHLRDPDTFAGQQMATAIGRLGNGSAIPALREALTDQNEAAQARAAHALGLLRAEEAVPALSRVLVTGGPMAEQSAAEALGTIGTSDAVAALMAPLADSQMTSARHAAMRGLEIAGKSAVGPLVVALANENSTVRANAAEMLGWLKPASETAGLAQALSDTSPSVRAQAAWALGEIGTPEARQVLASAVTTEKDAVARQATQSALAQVDAKAHAAPAVEVSPWSTLLNALTQIPASRWTFLALVTVLAVLLLWLGPRQARLRHA